MDSPGDGLELLGLGCGVLRVQLPHQEPSRSLVGEIYHDDERRSGFWPCLWDSGGVLWFHLSGLDEGLLLVGNRGVQAGL